MQEGKRGGAVRVTKAADVIGVLKRIPSGRREQVGEVTMDISGSMRDSYFMLSQSDGDTFAIGPLFVRF